ncbi:MAG: hypothetical protein PHE55_18270 [Methylococcaceae bacterium]|nr:hypothetical protein [Methylococcaceae bacterium]
MNTHNVPATKKTNRDIVHCIPAQANLFAKFLDNNGVVRHEKAVALVIVKQVSFENFSNITDFDLDAFLIDGALARAKEGFAGFVFESKNQNVESILRILEDILEAVKESGADISLSIDKIFEGDNFTSLICAVERI